MNSRLITTLLLGLIAFIITDSLAVVFIFLIIYVLGITILKIFKQDQKALNIFFITFGASLIYALLLHLYMQANGYEFLQSYDGYNVYLPYTQELLNSNSVFELITTIYDTSKYAFVGAILVPFVYVGKLAKFFGGDLYLPIQFTIMLFASLASVVVYNILIIKNISSRKAFRFTLLYSLLSVHFIMSTYIVRDMPITLFFYLLIFLSFKPFTTKRTLLMLAIVAAIMSIRLSSGVFASIYILLVLFLSDKKKSVRQKIMSLIFMLGCVSILIMSMDIILQSFESKYEHYAMLESQDQGGDSTLKTFDVLPPGISHLVKATYNQFMPIPSWRSMIETSIRPESYNIMNFPNMTNTFFSYVMWGVILISLFFKKFRSILVQNKLLFYHFIIAIIYLMVQSSTMGHRRMMGVYPVFFLIAVLFYQNFSKNDKKNVFGISILGFLLLQVFGAYYLI